LIFSLLKNDKYILQIKSALKNKIDIEVESQVNKESCFIYLFII